VYRSGCAQPLIGPTWYHLGEWTDGDGRPRDLQLRDGIDAELLGALMASPQPRVRIAVAEYPAAPSAVVAHLTTDPDRHVRCAALRHTHSAAILRDAAQGPDRGAVASNPQCPPDVLDTLSRDPAYLVRLNVVCNQATPAAILNAAVADPHEHVRWWALRKAPSQDLIRRAVADADLRTREAVAGNPHCPPALVARLAADPEPRVRGQAATNPACPDQVRRRLQTDPSKYVANLATAYRSRYSG
jgi:hypothetical protein